MIQKIRRFTAWFFWVIGALDLAVVVGIGLILVFAHMAQIETSVTPDVAKSAIDLHGKCGLAGLGFMVSGFAVDHHMFSNV